MSTATRRLDHLDVLRGLAMLGILPVNVWYFGLPMDGAADPAWNSHHGVLDTVAFHVTLALCQYKCISIFAFLFGAGLALVHEKTLARGDPWGTTLVRRSVVLFVIGCLHAVLLWHGDVVSIYAPIALVVGLAVTFPPRVLAAIGGTLILLPLGLLALGVLGALIGDAFTAEDAAGPAAALARADLATFLGAAFDAAYHRSPEFETAVFRDAPYVRVCVFRAVLALHSAVAAYAIYFGWRIAGLMCLGMAAVRGGWFRDPAAHPLPFRRMVVVGLAVGVPLQVAASLLYTDTPSARRLVHFTCLYLGSLGLAAAYAGVTALVTARLGVATLLRPLAAVGRTAFSNYVLQSILAGLWFYGVGAGRFDTLSHAELWLVTLAIFAVELIVSPLWLLRFRAGPIETLWRRLAARPSRPGTGAV